jgi:cytochrome c553
MALLMSLAAGNSVADDNDPVAHATAVRLAVGVCGTCHGPRGISQQPKYPRLAGQNANYLAAQIKAFRGQTRGDPDAISYMWGMASNLEDGTIDALALYYSGQTAGGAHGGDSALVARGKSIYEQGLAAVGVPACAACHGPDGHGIGDFPRLAGQHAQYILKQLRSFQSNMRNVAVMHGVAQGLKGDEMVAVAAFLESSP